jgi:hypothetical protein
MVHYIIINVRVVPRYSLEGLDESLCTSAHLSYRHVSKQKKKHVRELKHTEPSPRNACNEGLLGGGDGDFGRIKGESSVGADTDARDICGDVGREL